MFEAEEKHNQKYLPDLSLPAPPQPSLPAICPSVTNTTPLSTSTASVTASDTTTDTTFVCDSSTKSATAANSTTASLMASDSITASTIDLNSSKASTTASTTSTATTTAPASSATATAACTISATTTTPPATFTTVTNSTTAPYSGSTSKLGHVDNWKFHTFSSVMFVPDGITPSASKSIEDAKKKQRYIELANTRFHGNPFTETLSAAAMLEASAVQASKKEGKVGIDGKELGKETPRVNGYSFVTAPSPNPGVDASPLMTWGEVEGTPCQLDGSATPLIRRHTPGPSYRIPQLPSRDRLGHKLAEVARQKHRDKKTRVLRATRHSLGTPSGRTSVGSERVVGMSPAAQRLLTARLGVKHTDAALRASYTPSPSARYPNFTPTPSARRHHTPTTPHPATPTPTTNTPSRVNTPKILAGRRAGTSEEGEGLGGLTDNLLDLPKRSGNSGTQQTTDNLLDLPKHSSINSNSSSDISESNKGISSGRKCAADFF